MHRGLFAGKAPYFQHLHRADTLLHFGSQRAILSEKEWTVEFWVGYGNVMIRLP